MIRYPRRISAGRVVENQVRLMDVAPTILGLAQVQHPPRFGSNSEGPHRERDLTPWITDEVPVEPFPQLLAFGQLLHAQKEGHGSVSVRSDEAKIIQRLAQPEKFKVFQFANDAKEKHNLADTTEGDTIATRLLSEHRA